MGFFAKLFNKRSNSQKINQGFEESQEQAVLVKFNYGINELKPLHDLESLLEIAISESQVGEYDGHEISVDYSDGRLYMYGPNAETLFKTIKPILENSKFMKGAKATLRFGPPEDGIKEIEIEI